MKSTVFNLYNPEIIDTDPQFQVFAALFEAPTLPAYSILSHSLEYSDMALRERGGGPDYSVNNSIIRVENVATLLPQEYMFAKLSIMYAGIRDYSLLFPSLPEGSLRNRLAQFAEEADKAFENGAWMSFVLMAGAVIEGLLSHYFNSERFNGLINEAYEQKEISADEHKTLHEVRKARNIVHADNHNLPFVDRALAMDTFLVYDEMLKRVWPNKE